MAWTAFVVKLFNILSWRSFTVICPIYASFWVIGSDSHSKNQRCLTFWVLFAFITLLEQALQKLFLWLPFWPHVKGVVTVFLVMPYFGGAFYIYKRFVKSNLSENAMKWIIFVIPSDKCVPYSGQKNFINAVDANIIKDGHEDFDKSIFRHIFEPNYENVKERETTWPPSSLNVQKEWSCALCLVSTDSEKCLKKHLLGKEHKTNEENRQAEELVTVDNSSLTSTRETRMVLLGNLINLETWDGLLSPIAGSIRWCRWKRPDFGWIKLNTDGSIDRENAGIGGLLRDYKGDVICGFVSKAPRDGIFMVELRAIWRGLVLAFGLGIQAVWVESDSLSVVKTINREQPYTGKANRCLKRIRQLLMRFKKHKVSHSWRETNRAADFLAKMVLESNDVVLSPVGFPNNLRKIILDDARGKIYFRR